jgi:hypothetical protein
MIMNYASVICGQLLLLVDDELDEYFVVYMFSFGG